jgi:hypothetical protein
MTLIAGMVARRGQAIEGWLEIDGDRIAAAGTGARPGTADMTHDGIVALPAWPAPGGFADLVLLDADGRIERVMRRGRWRT